LVRSQCLGELWPIHYERRAGGDFEPECFLERCRRPQRRLAGILLAPNAVVSVPCPIERFIVIFVVVRFT